MRILPFWQLRSWASFGPLSFLVLAACSNNGFGSNFEGEVAMKTTHANAPAGTMTIKAKGDNLRIELPTPDGKTASAIYDAKLNKMSVLLDAQKMSMEMDMGAP